MYMKDFATSQEAYDYIRTQVGYVAESMFFDPRRKNAQYDVKSTDLLLVKTEIDTYRWIPAENFGCLVVGHEFKDVLAEFKAIVAIAIPRVYEFSMDGIHNLSAYFDWCAVGSGFGQMSFGYDREEGHVTFDTEMLGPENTRLMLHQLVDFLVDNGVSSDWRPRND